MRARLRRVRLLLCTALAFGWPTVSPAFNDTSIAAQGCSVAAGRDATGNTVSRKQSDGA